MDALVCPVWIGCNFLLGIAAWRIARSWFPDECPLSMIMHTVVLSWAAIVAVAFVLGVATFLVAWALMLGVTFLAVGALIGLRLVHQPGPVPTPTDYRSEVYWSWFWFGVFSVWIAHSVTSGLLKFPTDWDTLHYHLPIIVHWLQAGSLYAPDNCLWSSPGNNEILGLWLVAPFSGDFLIAFNNLPASILLACAAVEVGKQLGLSAALAHVTSFAVVSNFIVLNQLLDASNDVPVAALFLACVAYGFRFTKDRRTRISPAVVLFALAIGLLAGVKYFALGYAAVVGTVFFLVAWKQIGWRIAAQFAVLVALGLLLWGGYWYLRNSCVAGSPLHPKSFDPEADVITKIYPDIARTSFIGNGRPELYELAVKAVWQMAGPCHVAAFVAFPVTLVWLLISGWISMRKHEVETADARWTIAFLIAGAFAIIFITPFAVEDQPGTLNQMHWHYCPVRYGFSFLSLTVVGLALVLADIFYLISTLAWLPNLFFLVGGVYQLMAPDPRLPFERIEVFIIAGNLLLLAANGVLIAKVWPRLGRVCLQVAGLASLAGCALGIEHLATNWHQGFPTFYDRILSPGTYSFLAKEPETCRICVLDYRAYPFFGSRRQFQLCQPMFIPSPSWLMDYMQTQDVQFVAARPRRLDGNWHLFVHFEECLRDHPAVFHGPIRDNNLALFRIVRARKN